MFLILGLFNDAISTVHTKWSKRDSSVITVTGNTGRQGFHSR